MISGRPSPPDPTEAHTVASFVRLLSLLKQWAGEPSLSRLRLLGGSTATADDSLVDALPKSTTSHLLRQTDKLPRWDFVKAFVAACLRHADYPADLIPGELERWRAARSALAEPAAHASPARPGGVAPPAPSVPTPDQLEPPKEVVVQAPVLVVAAGTAAPAGVGGRPAPDPAVELLARRVAKEEDRARKGLLGGYSIAPVSFGPLDDGAGEALDDLPSIGRFFGALRPQRLLVVGESGAGKTVLAIELVLQLVEPIVGTGERAAGSLPLVPVRLNAARWTPGCAFDQWLGEQVVHGFGITAADAARLVRDRRVLPVLDGLDELDPEPAAGPPRRAIGLLTELNRYSDLSGRRPGAVVVTCRTDRHAQLVAARVGLDNATHVRLHDLTVDQISAYLHARWPDHHPCGPHRDDVLAALSGAEQAGAAVHSALRTPWRLSLAATVVESGADLAELLYVAPGADPGEAAARIGRRLLEAYVPAATELTSRTARRSPYDPAQVRSWLVRLAHHLRWQAARAAELDRPPPGLTAIDIVPHLLWPIGGWRSVRVLHCLCCAILAVIAMMAFRAGSAAGLRDGSMGHELLTLTLMAGWVSIAIGPSLVPWPAAARGRANVPCGGRLIGGVLGAVVGGPVGALGARLALTGGSAFGPVFATAVGVTGGAVFGALIGLTATGGQRAGRTAASEAIRAQPLTILGFGVYGALTGLTPLRLDGADNVSLAVGLTAAFILASALGVVFEIVTGGWSKYAERASPRAALHRDPMIGLVFGLTAAVAAAFVFVRNNGIIESLAHALIGGVAFGLAFGAITLARAMIGLTMAAARGLLPLRLWTFLDWACEARLLRISGATYQFLHRELQDFLATAEDADGP